MKKGFSLLGIIIAVAIIALMAWGGKNFYGDYFKQEKSVIENSTSSLDAANALKDINDARKAEIQKELNQ